MTSFRSVVNEPFVDYETTVARCVEEAGATVLITDGRPIMLKPNLVNDSPHPITTPPAMGAAVITYLRKHSHAPS